MFRLLFRINESLLKRKIKFQNKISIKSFKGKLEISKGVKFNQLVEFYGKGTIKIGEGSFLGYRIGGNFKGGICEIQTREKNAIIKIGKNLAANNNLYICARKSIKIGNDVLIGKNVTILDHNAHGVDPRERRSNPGTPSDIEIKDNVWLGNDITILPGTIIGKNSIVGVGSVIKGKFPENVIISGNPAKIIKKIKEVNNNEKI